MSPQQVLDLIEDILTTHHALLKETLSTVGAGLTGETAATFGELQMLMEGHLMKEETILFPNIQGIARGMEIDGCGLIGPIRQMRHEHTQIRALEERLRADAERGVPGSEALLVLLDDLAVHAEKEDTLLFPAAMELSGMPEPDWEALDAEDEPPARPRVVSPTPKPGERTGEAPRRSLLGRIARRLRR